MIKEYIDELILENTERLKNLERQMKKFLDELDGEKEWLETLQEQKNLDKSIFSPRALDPDLKGRTEEAQNKIRKTEQDIEHVRVLIEEQLKKKEEYGKLLQELENFSETESSGNTQTANGEDDGNTEVDHRGDAEEESACKREESIISGLLDGFLPDIYKKTELCLALLYSDKVRCKNELKSMKSMIKNMSDELKKNRD